jgi:uncharacterized membrane protein
MRADGAHTHHHHCGGGLGLAVIVIGLAGYVISRIGSAAKSAADTAGHVLAAVLEVVLITVALAAGLAVFAGIIWAGIRLWRWHRSRRPAVAPVVVQAQVLPPVNGWTLAPPSAHAIGPSQPQVTVIPGRVVGTRRTP